MAQFTTQGEQYIGEKAGTNGAFVITHFVLANIDGLDHTTQPPIGEQMPDPAYIVDEQPVTQSGYLNANQAVYSLVLDSTIGDYEFNWIGLKTDDGRLLSVAYDAPQQKLRYDGLQEGNNITRNFVIEFEGVVDAAGITVSAETWQIDYAARLNQIDENQRLFGRDMFGENTFFNDGFKVVKEGSNHIIKSGVGYIEGIRLFLAADINLGPLANKSIWIDAAIVNDNGIAVGVVNHKISLKNAVEINYVSTEQHYLLKIGEVDYNGAVTDKRNAMDEEIETGGVAKGLKIFAKNEVEALSAVISSMFAGQVSTFAGTKVPVGWLKANGATVLRSEYAYLWNYANVSGNIAASEATKKAGQFGPGNGNTTFTLPDLRGQHLRYWDDGRGIDSGRGIASEQLDDIKQHNHNAISENAGSHSHTASTTRAGNHGHTASTENAGNHSHSQIYHAYQKPGNEKNRDSSDNSGVYKTKQTGEAGDHNHTVSVNQGGAHTHGVTVNSTGNHTHGVTVENTGIDENRVKNVALMVCIKY